LYFCMLMCLYVLFEFENAIFELPVILDFE
jgi:hypothetical protein